MSDFNIDINKDETIGHDKLDVFCDTLNLTNLVKSDTCYTNNHKSTIDLFLTNKRRSFQYTTVTERGLIDCYTNNHKSTIDLFLTNKRRSFQYTTVTERGLSVCHRLITTFMKSHFSKLKSIVTQAIQV